MEITEGTDSRTEERRNGGRTEKTHVRSAREAASNTEIAGAEATEEAGTEGAEATDLSSYGEAEQRRTPPLLSSSQKESADSVTLGCRALRVLRCLASVYSLHAHTPASPVGVHRERDACRAARRAGASADSFVRRALRGLVHPAGAR